MEALSASVAGSALGVVALRIEAQPLLELPRSSRGA